MNKFFGKIGGLIMAHKIVSTIVLVVLVYGGYKTYTSVKAANITPQYSVTPASTGNIVQSVSGTGQVIAANQIDVTSQASGAITSIKVKVGDHVAAGDILATIDDTNAKNTLANAELSYAQTVEPAKAGDVNNAKNALDKSYSDGLNSVRSSFTDLQNVMSGLNSMLYGSTGFLNTSYSTALSDTSKEYRDTSGKSFDFAKSEYQNALVLYANITNQSSTSTIESVIGSTSLLLRKVATALQDTQNAVAFIVVNQPDYHPSISASAVSSVSSWIATINGDVSSVTGANNSIATNKNTLGNLLIGPDTLTLQSSELALKQAQETYKNYFIRAPFAGVIGRIPVSLYTQASGSTVVATLVGSQKITNISLDEVDAAKVAVGDKVNISFDAIDNLSATGTVGEVDLVGTVSQGVVSYNVKILIETEDDRIRPGMSISADIIIKEKDGVIIVPTAAVKTLRNESYVQVLDRSRASSTPTRLPKQVSLTIPSATPPKNVTVTTGLSDDTNTEIVSGLTGGEWIVTKTVTGSAAVTTAPSIFSAIGARSGSAGTGGAGTRPANATFRTAN